MMAAESGYVLLARLVKPQGRHGEMLADILTDFPERFSERRHVWLLPADAPAPAREAEIESHWLHKGRVVLKLAGVSSINDAETLRGWRVAVPREARTPVDADTFYIGDLVGCTVVDETTGGKALGTIADVERGEGGAADLLVVKRGDDELLIPFAKAYLVAAELDARRLRMRLPAGLAEMNAPMSEAERTAAAEAADEDDDAL